MNGYAHLPSTTWYPLEPSEVHWRRLGQRPVIAWLTGLSSADKSSSANAAIQKLPANGRHCMVLDGDELRQALSSDLGFSSTDCASKIRRAEVARLMAEKGLVFIVALVSPSRSDRAIAQPIARDILLVESIISYPLSVCKPRDQKGLHNKARADQMLNFMKISAPYEVPTAPDFAT